MKFYITIEGIPKLKKCFLNLKLFSIIDVPGIFENYGYTLSTIDEYSSFIISNHITESIKTFSKSKRIRGIIYSNPNINESLINNLKNIISDLEPITTIVLLDDYNVPKLEYLYPNFNEIVFFPTIKKIKLIEAVSFKKHLRPSS